MGGKLLSSPEKGGVTINTNDAILTTSSKSINVMIYVLCITSLVFSAYTSFNQTYLEHRIRQLQQLDDRITVLEKKLRIFPNQFLESLATTSIPLSPSSPSSSSIQSAIDDAEISNSTITTESYDEFSNIVRKLSLQLSGIHRLRRDVSHLQASSRRGARQTSVQQSSSDCTCPPGKYYSINCTFRNYITRTVYPLPMHK